MNPLINSLFFGVWAMDHERSISFLPEVKKLLEGTSIALSPEQIEAYRAAHQPILFNASGGSVESDGGDDRPENAQLVMVLPMRGPILRDDAYCGPIGTETRAKWLRQADADPRIVGVVLDANSPGGEGSGMRVMNQQLARMKKPVVTYVNNGLACSAMMGIASRTREIILSGKEDILGSIGTYLTIADLKKYYKDEMNLIMHDVYATASTQKNRPFLEALKADPSNPKDAHYDLLRSKILDPFNEAFIAEVKEGRPQVKDQEGVFNGDVFFGDDAIRLGLADSYGTLDNAIQRVRDLATSDKASNSKNRNQATINSQHPPNTMSVKTILHGLATALGFAQKEEVTNEVIAEANTALAEEGITNVAFVSTAEQTRLSTAAADVANANSKVDAAEAKVTEAESKATAAEDKATKAAAETTTATAATTALQSAIDAAAKEAGVEVKEGVTALDAMVATLKTNATALADANKKITTLEASRAEDGQPDGVVSEEGDTNDHGNEDLTPEEKAFRETNLKK